MQTAKASRKQSSLSGKESAQGCTPKRLLGRPDEALGGEGMEPKQKQHSVVDVTGDRSKVQCYKEQYCIGTRNVRSMNQGKLPAVKFHLSFLSMRSRERNSVSLY